MRESEQQLLQVLRQEIESLLPKDPLLEGFVKKVLKHIVGGGMSFGSISLKAHETIAIAFNILAMIVNDVSSIEALTPDHFPMSNSGEGGELRSRDESLSLSRVRQFASGRFGVTGEYLAKAHWLQFKASQAAKPAIGGELPGKKVTGKIAEARGTQPGITLISPANSHDNNSIEDLAQIVYDLRSSNPFAKLSIKLTATEDLAIIVLGSIKAGFHNVVIGGPGGTGAAPTTAKYEYAFPWELALPQAHQLLTESGWRQKVTLTASGNIQTPEDVVKAFFLGADFVEIGTGLLVSMGCVMARDCHLNTCPTGIATSNEALVEATFRGTPVQVARYLITLAREVAELLLPYGFKDPGESIGRSDLLEVVPDAPIKNLELLLKQSVDQTAGLNLVPKPLVQGSSPEEAEIIAGIGQGKKEFTVKARNGLSSFGARIQYKLLTNTDFKTHFQSPIIVKFNGFSVGQSFGFVAPAGLTLWAENSNDGAGKSLNGATLFIKGSIGNFAGYGATKGKLFARAAGERCGVRNSGATIVVESAGAMSGNFMTLGTFVVLGNPRYYDSLKSQPYYSDCKDYSYFRQEAIGPNFGAGFTGGVIYLPKILYDEMAQKGYLSQDILNAETSLVSGESSKTLQELITEYNLLEVEWVQQLTQQPNYTSEFFVLKPSGKKSISGKETEKKGILPTDSQETQVAQFLENPPQIPPNSSFSVEVLPVDRREKDACGVGMFFARKRQPTRETVQTIITMLARFKHRGTTGVDPETGDGCGILWYGTDAFFQAQFPHLRLLPGSYSIIPIYLPSSETELTYHERVVEELDHCLARQKLSFVKANSRKVPTNRSLLGAIGQRSEPSLYQFVVQKPASFSQTEFERGLALARLQFELWVQRAYQENPGTGRPHIVSASSYNVIYKSLVLEDRLGEYFEDFSSPDFKAYAGIVHARFATNSFPVIQNIQPCPRFANNGENNALAKLLNFLNTDPHFKKWLSVERVDFRGLSDSHIMSIFMEYLHSLGYSAEEIARSTIHPYHPRGNTTSTFYNLLAIPFEGPNASIISLENQIVGVRDRNGFRPLVGWMREEAIYLGSEWGAVEPEGPARVFHLSPAQPIVIDLQQNSIEVAQESHLDRSRSRYAQQIGRLATLNLTRDLTLPDLFLTEGEYALRKLQAGWNESYGEQIMEALFLGRKSLGSMGDHSAIEIAVPGRHLLGNYLKGKFAQITNPSLSNHQEGCYVTPQTFVGIRPPIPDLKNANLEGFLLSSPVVDNTELQVIKENPVFKGRTMIIPIVLEDSNEGPPSRQNWEESVMRIKNGCIEAIRAGKIFLILSDVKCTKGFLPLFGVQICQIVDIFLKEEGLRSSITLVLQSSFLLAGRDIAQAISVGGADLLNPYLPCMHRDVQQVKNYVHSVTQELLDFMAHLGISSVSAYRGSQQFNGLGLDSEFRLNGTFGGLTIEQSLEILYTNHHRPLKEETGKYNPSALTEARMPTWHPGVVSALIKSARATDPTESTAAFQDMVKAVEGNPAYGLPRKYLRLVPPQRWGEKQPLRVALVGAGAAGFYLAQALLKSGLPIQITLFESAYVNKFGLVGDGIAPDHAGTKKAQFALLGTVLKDNRLTYCGGVSVGPEGNFTVGDLKKHFACVVDCSGAKEDKKLGIAGENPSEGVISASDVYHHYNDAFNPFKPWEWPFKSRSKAPTIGIIGSGNVAADLARILLKDPNSFDKNLMNPDFLDKLSRLGCDRINIFARGAPFDCKMGIAELEELAKLDIEISTHFDSGFREESLTLEAQKRMAFFTRYQNRTMGATPRKQLHFYFNHQPVRFSREEEIVKATFKRSDGSEIAYLGRHYIIAIGTSPRPVPGCDYQTGWATGVGGTIAMAESGAEEVAQQIVNDFHRNKFPYFSAPQEEAPWEYSRLIDNSGQLNILNYLSRGNRITDANSFRQAMRGRSGIIAIETAAESAILAQRAAYPPIPDPTPGQMTIYGASGVGIAAFPRDPDENLLNYLLQQDSTADLRHDCNGAKTCGTCVIEIKSTKTIPMGNREANLLKVLGLFSPHQALACFRTLREVMDIEDSATGCTIRALHPVSSSSEISSE